MKHEFYTKRLKERSNFGDSQVEQYSKDFLRRERIWYRVQSWYRAIVTQNSPFLP